MSTKIYNAYKLAADAGVFAFRRELRTIIAPHIYGKAVNNRVAQAVYAWDNQVAQGHPRTFREELIKELKQYDKGRRDSLFDDPLANATAVVMHNAIRDELYVMCFGAVADERDMLLALPSVAGEFGYWDNSDEPESMNWEEWQDRAKAWDEAMDAGGMELPIVQGVNIELFSDFDRYLYTDKIQKRSADLSVPTDERRVTKLALNLFVTAYSDSLADKNDFTATIMGKMGSWIDVQHGQIPDEEKQPFLDQATAVIAAQPEINLGAL